MYVYGNTNGNISLGMQGFDVISNFSNGPAIVSGTADNTTHLEPSVNSVSEEEEAMLVSQSPELANIHIISFLNLKRFKMPGSLSRFYFP